MDNGHIILDVSGKEKEKLTVQDLLSRFDKVGGVVNDSMVLG